ncbi:unnamed protein product, partial [Ranitomeya imitator]
MDIRGFCQCWKWQVVCSFLLCSWGWVSGQLRYSTVEESEPGTLVGNVAQDLGIKRAEVSQRRIHLRSEKYQRYFSVNQANGGLVVKDRIDRESLCGSSPSCLLQIEVVAENPVELFTLEIEILDINDNSPTFSSINQIIQITELVVSPGARFALDIAEDLDVGVNGVSQYTLNTNPYFSLSVKNRKDGTLIPQLILEKVLDREEKQEHHLILTAIDGGEPARSGTCRITIAVLDINDNLPVFNQSVYKISIRENLPLNTVILTLNATDQDDGANGEIQFYFDGHTSKSTREKFSLNEQNGEISIIGHVDFEEQNFYELSIKAEDKGFPKLEGNCVVHIEVEDVNDNSPEITFSTVLNIIPENTPIGIAIGHINLKDEDSGKNGEVKLSLSPNVPFKIRLHQNRYALVTDGKLDREETIKYTIELTASDFGSPPLYSKTSVTVRVSDINDNAPVFTQSTYNAFIKENSDPGTLLCTVSATDLDEGDNSDLVYSIVESQIDGSSVSSFVYINSIDGNIYAQRSFDYEQIQVLQITIKVEDSGSPQLSSTVPVFIFILDTNDNSPSLLYPEHSEDLIVHERIPKSTSAGYLVTKLSAVDLDSGHNAWLVFTLIDPISYSSFQVSKLTGEYRNSVSEFRYANIGRYPILAVSECSTLLINVYFSPCITDLRSRKERKEIAEDLDVGVNGVSQYTLNTNPYFSLSVKNPIDGGEPARSGTCRITIVVLDINDNPPVFNQSVYKISISENLPLNTVILTLNATDQDDGANSEIQFSFDGHTSKSAREIFSLNEHNGKIYIKGHLDFEEKSFYELSIKAEDKGIPKLEGNCIVHIDMEDVNDNSPEITFSTVLNIIPENTPKGIAIGYINVKDEDSGKNGEMKLSLSPNVPFKIRLHQNRYTLVTDGNLDREETAQYTIELTASDLGSPPLYSKTSITFGVSDINDNAPVFTQSTYNAFIKENSDPGTLLCTVAATDLDEGVNSDMVYSIVESQIDGSSVSSFVYIHSNDGTIYAQRSFDYEQIQVFQITIKVEDSGSPQLSSTVPVFIFILDTNDNPPSLLYPEYSENLIIQERIPKSASAGYLVTKLSAVDLDSGHNAWLMFTLIDPINYSSFQVSKLTGEVRTVRGLQETENMEQQLVISISDQGTPPLSTTVTVLLSIADEVIVERPKSGDFLTNSKPPSDMTLYLIISLVAISLVSLVTFMILLVKCLRKDSYDYSSSCCILGGSQSKSYTDQYQPALYLNTDGTLKYMEVRMVPPGSQGQSYQTNLPPITNHQDFSIVQPINYPQLKDVYQEASSEGNSSNDPNN